MHGSRFIAWMIVLLGSSVLAASAACSDSSSDKPATAIDAGPEIDAGSEEERDGGAPEKDAGGLEPMGETALEAVINGVSRPLDRAQFGVTTAPSGKTYYLEAHEGGVAACPETETPDRTLVVDGVPQGVVGQSFDESDGVTASFLDFVGDQITADNPTTKATAVKVTIVAVKADTSLELEFEASFAEGEVTGRIAASYCDAFTQSE